MKRKTKKRVSTFDADHPYRQAAIATIERVIEPILQTPLNGEHYYNTEDAIVFTIVRLKNKQKKTIKIIATTILEDVIRPMVRHGINTKKLLSADKDITSILKIYILKRKTAIPSKFDNDKDVDDGETFNPFVNNEDDDEDDDNGNNDDWN